MLAQLRLVRHRLAQGDARVGARHAQRDAVDRAGRSAVDEAEQLVAVREPGCDRVGIGDLVAIDRLDRVERDHADRRSLPPARLDARSVPSAKGERDGAVRDRLQRRRREEHQTDRLRQKREAGLGGEEAAARREPEAIGSHSRRRLASPSPIRSAKRSTGSAPNSARECTPADPVDPPQPERDRLERARLRVEHLAIGQRTLPRLGSAEVPIEVAHVPRALGRRRRTSAPRADAGVRRPGPVGGVVPALATRPRPGAQLVMPVACGAEQLLRQPVLLAGQPIVLCWATRFRQRSAPGRGGAAHSSGASASCRA